MAVDVQTTPVLLRRKRFNLAEYHLMAEAGILGEGERLELIGGEIIEMSPVGRKHKACVDRLDRVFNRLVGDNAIVHVQSPVPLGADFEPIPDVTLLKLRPDFYSESDPQPTDVLLVVEVSDTTIKYDREVKLPLYARAGLAEVWIVNLPGEVVEVYSNPEDGVYSDFESKARPEVISVLALPSVKLSVEEILGPTLA